MHHSNSNYEERRRRRRGVRRRAQNENEKMVDLPQELIHEILLRLPVKSLIRFKTVCKSWLSHISDPHFTASHFKLGAAPTERLLFLSPIAREFLSIDFNESLNDDSASAALNCDFVEHFDYLEIIGSCRGFLLLDFRYTLCVWNPSTGVHQFVKWSPFVSSNIMGLDVGDEFSLSIRGFGYDPSTDDYLAVLASCNDELVIIHMEYFSLRANTWKEIEASHLSFAEIAYNEVGSFLNTAIHWLAFSLEVSMDVIVAFDLTERSFSEILLPIDFDLDNFQLCVLAVLGELLNLCAVEEIRHSVEIWAMGEYKVRSSWTKTTVVSLDYFSSLSLFPICSTEDGDIVGTDGCNVLIKCNDEGQLQEYQIYSNGPYRSAVYTESLLSLPCDREPAENV
ncbi:hypothetical protein JHK87_045993 [Glycine soja]|nr:hypothetical protein JHK87_045993 [Glycine soja]